MRRFKVILVVSPSTALHTRYVDALSLAGAMKCLEFQHAHWHRLGIAEEEYPTECPGCHRERHADEETEVFHFRAPEDLCPDCQEARARDAATERAISQKLGK